jgi:F0F1-type ATP synthase membrane subunit a
VAELAHRGLWALALAVLVMNLPFGFWRAGVKRFTRPWFIAVHAPVPFVILLRVVSGLGWHLVSFPVLVGAFFTGQFLGGALRRRR